MTLLRMCCRQANFTRAKDAVVQSKRDKLPRYVQNPENWGPKSRAGRAKQVGGAGQQQQQRAGVSTAAAAPAQGGGGGGVGAAGQGKAGGESVDLDDYLGLADGAPEAEVEEEAAAQHAAEPDAKRQRVD